MKLKEKVSVKTGMHQGFGKKSFGAKIGKSKSMAEGPACKK